MSYKHLTLSERKYLQQLLSEGLGVCKIATALGRSPSTISREIRRNRAQYKPHRKPDNKYWYNHWRAQNLYIHRRRQQARRALLPDTEEWNFIVAGLQKYWSPEAISGRWHKEFPDRKPLCVSTIYRNIRLNRFPKISAKTHLRRKNKRFVPRDANFNTIHPDRTIPEWPDVIRDRLRIGDWRSSRASHGGGATSPRWHLKNARGAAETCAHALRFRCVEGDTVYGGVGKGGLVTCVDRQKKLLKMRRILSRNATETRLATEKALEGLPVNSISFDNGSEFSEFRELEKNLNTLVYFAEPHKPWQRGTNENTNDIIRFFFPKGFDFRTITDEDVQYVEDLINDRPRKCLDWKSPNEAFEEDVALR